MPQLNDFEIPRRSLNWAKEAIQESHVVLESYFARVRGVEVTDIDPETGLHHFKVKLSESIPDRVDRRIFEAISNTKNAFDQAMFAAVCAINRRPKSGDVHFPWRSSLEDLNRRMENAKANIPRELHDVIRKHEPYPRSDPGSESGNQIREIAKLANQKHTVSVRVVGYVSGGRFPDSYTTGNGEIGPVIHPALRWDPVHNEMTVLVHGGNLKIKNNYRFAFHVVFQESGALKNVPAMPVVDAFAAKAEAVINDLEAECRKITG
ncbi:MAG: hypothetical protein IPK75_03140 [Acidobacteria bacterium]|nr:hypothetical protein [Acidobacteriota bacterium]